MRIPILLVALGLIVFSGLVLLPAEVEERMNGVVQPPPYEASHAAIEQIASSPIVDLHADSLLWGRDLLQRFGRGHVDVPRLREAHVAIQVFGVVTQSPKGMNVHRNATDEADLITALAVASRWPPKTWRSFRERALYQARRLQQMADRSDGQLVFLRTRAEVESLLRTRSGVGAVLGLEGSQALEGNLENVDVLAEAGFRMMSPAHFTDTDISGSAHGARQGGLSPLGKAWLAKLEKRRILVDLAHASPAAVDDILAAAKRPVVVSHTGVQATCDSPRNLSDGQIRGVARNGGVIGIGFWAEAVCGSDARAIARAIRHAADVAGVAHVALGSDFDGAVRAPFDVTGLPLLVDALRAQRFSDEEIRSIVGGNAARLLASALP